MRDADLAISSYLLRRLRAAADLMELPNAEAVAELFLEERLSQMPEVEALIREQKAVSAKIREEWKYNQKQRKAQLLNPSFWNITQNEQPRP